MTRRSHKTGPLAAFGVERAHETTPLSFQARRTQGEQVMSDELLKLAAEALRGALPMSSDGTGHIDCEYDQERNPNCGCIDVLPRAATAVLGAVLPVVAARVEGRRRSNPMNGDGYNFALGDVLSELGRLSTDDGMAVRAAVQQVRDEKAAADAELYERLATENRARRTEESK